MPVSPRVACILAAVMLAACSQPPPVTPTPTRTPLPQEAATPTESLPIVEPVIVGEEVRVISWSPDSRWLAFLYNETFDQTLEASGRVRVAALHFYDAETGRICAHPEFESTEFKMPLEWQPDGSVLIGVDDAAYTGMPCAPIFALSTQPAPQLVGSFPPSEISRGGSYQYQIEDIGDDDWGYKYRVTFAEVATGELMMTYEFEFEAPRMIRWIEPGEWLTDTLFLTEMMDGTETRLVMIDVSQQTTIDMAVEIPQLDSIAQTGNRYRPHVVLGSSPDSYHILFHDSNDSDGPDILLYHPESGTVETLAFLRLWLSDPSSPDGYWILLERRVPGEEPDSEIIEMWARPIDPSSSEAEFVVKSDYYSAFNEDWTRFAVAPNSDETSKILVYEFPSGELVTEWSSPGYSISPSLWSPDGKWLVIYGSREGEFGKTAVFVVDVEP